MNTSGYQLAETLFRAGTAVAATLDREEAIERILEQLAHVVPYDSASVQLLREDYLEIVGGRAGPGQKSVVGTRFPVPGDNPNTNVIQQRRPCILGDAPAAYAEAFRERIHSHIRSWLGVPLVIQDQVIGMLTVDSVQPDYFTSDHARLVTAFAGQMAVAIENSRLYAEAQQRVAELEALRRTSLKFTSSLDPADVLDSIAESALDLVGATDCIIYLYDEANDSFSFGTASGEWVSADRIKAPRRDGVTATVVREGRPVVIDTASSHPLFTSPEAREWDVQATAAFPLQRPGQTLGVLHVLFRGRAHSFSDDELRVLGLLADQAAIALDNARLFEAMREKEEELRESEEEFRTLYEVTRDAVMLLDEESFFDCNPATLEIFGCETKEQFVGKHPSEFSPEYQPGNLESTRLSAQRIEMALRDGSCFFEWQHKRLDGTEFPAEVLLSAMEIKGRKVLQAVVRDITQRKAAEAELQNYQEHLEELVEERTADLRESEERYRTLFDGVPSGLFRSTPDGPIVDANLAMVQMLDYPSREELLASDAVNLYVDAEKRIQGRALLDREGVVRDFEVQMYKYDGSAIWVSQTARAVRDGQGQVLYHEGSLEDIGERKKLEEEIRRQKDYFEALFINSPVAVATADLDANVVSWNPMAEQLFGYTQEEVIGRQLDDLVANDPTIRDEALGYSRQALTRGRVHATTTRTRKDGSVVDVEVLALPVTVGDEDVGFIVIYHDIGELQKARREAEAANQAKSEFLANMSHELRTPLNAIIGFTRIVKRQCKDILPEKHSDNLEKVLVSANHLLGLINDVLDLSKIEAGRAEVQPVTFDAAALVDTCLRTVQPLVKGDRLRLEKEIEPDLPPLFTDQHKVRQILINLLSNAVKFTEDGSITVSAQRRENMLALAVTDTGIGIPQDAQEHIFDEFRQVDSSVTRQHGGTGLGLSISRQLARLLGGDLAVESTFGVGSTFTATIPIRYQR